MKKWAHDDPRRERHAETDRQLVAQARDLIDEGRALTIVELTTRAKCSPGRLFRLGTLGEIEARAVALRLETTLAPGDLSLAWARVIVQGAGNPIVREALVKAAAETEIDIERWYLEIAKLVFTE